MTPFSNLLDLGLQGAAFKQSDNGSNKSRFQDLYGSWQRDRLFLEEVDRSLDRIMEEEAKMRSILVSTDFSILNSYFVLF
ncbi:hypothetical protein L1049_006748 [Liquidambar formosana]|uniref:Uncharacterized protein n=1 Tax=Liquidambar formosana TaxID=63359 RepID=A0AAP0WRT2_LIQFO